jgi:hypothetical protein
MASAKSLAAALRAMPNVAGSAVLEGTEWKLKISDGKVVAIRWDRHKTGASNQLSAFQPVRGVPIQALTRRQARKPHRLTV